MFQQRWRKLIKQAVAEDFRYPVDRSTAQAIRASLLASATITVLRWARVLGARSQLPSEPSALMSEGSAARAA